MKSSAIIKIKDISKIYRVEEVETVALDRVSFTINRGKQGATMGQSGADRPPLTKARGAS